MGSAGRLLGEGRQVEKGALISSAKEAVELLKNKLLEVRSLFRFGEYPCARQNFAPSIELPLPCTVSALLLPDMGLDSPCAG